MRIVRRGVTSLVVAGTLLLALGVPAAMAAPAERFSYEVWFAEGTNFDGPNSVDVVAQVGKRDHEAFRELSVNNWTVQDICEGPGGEPGTIAVNTFGTSETATIKFDKKLASATASGPVAVSEVIVNSCTGEETPGDSYTVDVSLDLHAVAGTTSTKSHTSTKFPDGSKLVEDFKSDSRDAEGTMTVGGTTVGTNYGTVITHQTLKDVFTPAH